MSVITDVVLGKDIGSILADNHGSRVMADGGTFNYRKSARAIMRMLKANGMYEPTKHMEGPILGLKERVSGINTYASKSYSADPAKNDAVQATELSQPWKSGNIAPNEVPCLLNPTGATRFMSHPSITFENNQEYSFSVLLNYFGSSSSSFLFYSTTSNYWSYLDLRDNNVLRLRLGNGINYTFSSFNTNTIINKATLINISIDNNSNATLRVNGVNIQTISGASTATTFSFFPTSIASSFKGKLFYYRIQSGAMSAGQALAEYNTLRGIVPERESVTIGSQSWTTSNLDIVCDASGNVIPEMQAATLGVEKTINGNFALSTGWTLGTDASISSGKLVLNNGATARASRSDFNLSPNKWHKLTIDVVTATGATQLKISNVTEDKTYYSSVVTVGSYTVYLKQGGTDDDILIRLVNGTGTLLELDNLSVKELGWVNATEIYDAVYAATSGDAATKALAAWKEAAMWCYYNNDSAVGAINGKLYNWYAVALIDFALAATSSEFRVPTQAQFNTLVSALGGASVAGGKMKVAGTSYWTTPNTGSDNLSGFSSIGSGQKSETTGAHQFINTKMYLLSVDKYRLYCSNDSAATVIQNITGAEGLGHSIRLVKNL